MKKRSPQEQSDAFVEAARKLECDDDEAAFDERLKRIAKHKPKPKDEEAPPD